MKPLFPDVIVNGETISSAAIAAEAQNHQAPADKPGYAWQAAARALAVRTLLLQEAARHGLTPAPQALSDDLLETDEEALIREVTEQAIKPRDVTDEDCRTAYDKNPDRFRSPDLFEPAHILFAADPARPEDRETARQKAVKALSNLLENPKAFAEIAKEHSACSSRDNGGSLGQVSSGDTVAEFEHALQGMEAGELLSEPVESKFGFHIIRLDAKVQGTTLPFEGIKTRIHKHLEQVEWVLAAKKLTSQLIEDADITGIEFSKPMNAAA